MAKKIPARFIGRGPMKHGTVGHVQKARGYNDPNSSDYLAWIFRPEGRESLGGYYLDEEEWENRD